MKPVCSDLSVWTSQNKALSGLQSHHSSSVCTIISYNRDVDELNQNTSKETFNSKEQTTTTKFTLSPEYENPSEPMFKPRHSISVYYV